MESIARLGLFGFAYITIYILSTLVASESSENSSILFENFHGVSFLIVTLILVGWTYFTHFRDKEVPRNLKESLQTKQIGSWQKHWTQYMTLMVLERS